LGSDAASSVVDLAGREPSRSSDSEEVVTRQSRPLGTAPAHCDQVVIDGLNPSMILLPCVAL